MTDLDKKPSESVLPENPTYMDTAMVLIEGNKRGWLGETAKNALTTLLMSGPEAFDAFMLENGEALDREQAELIKRLGQTFGVG